MTHDHTQVGEVGSLVRYWDVETIVALSHGQLPSNWAVVALAVAVVGLLTIATKIWARQCVAVPGALIVRTASGLESAWRLEMFPRNESVLVYWAERGTIALARRTGRAADVSMALRTAETAVRAWLSPLPPPTLDRLTDLR